MAPRQPAPNASSKFQRSIEKLWEHVRGRAPPRLPSPSLISAGPFGAGHWTCARSSRPHFLHRYVATMQLCKSGSHRTTIIGLRHCAQSGAVHMLDGRLC
jgi:hypothetical protein